MDCHEDKKIDQYHQLMEKKVQDLACLEEGQRVGHCTEILKICRMGLELKVSSEKNNVVTLLNKTKSEIIKVLEVESGFPVSGLKRKLPSSEMVSTATQVEKVGKKNVSSQTDAPKLESVGQTSSSKTSREQEDGEMIADLRETMVSCPKTPWSAIAGLDEVKKTLQMSVCLPVQRPDLFVGPRAPVKGILLYGPPGTGKTMLAKAVASQAGCSFFSISSSTFSSKYVGDSERRVKNLFILVQQHTPAVVFFDEIDGICSQRGNSNESESSRKLKSELLTKMDGASSESQGVTFLAASNHPWDVDPAIRRRLGKRIYIPLPLKEEIRVLVQSSLKGLQVHKSVSFDEVSSKLIGYSCSDVVNVCKEASMIPLETMFEEKGYELIVKESVANLNRPILLSDISKAMQRVTKSVSTNDVARFQAWRKQYGSGE